MRDEKASRSLFSLSSSFIFSSSTPKPRPRSSPRRHLHSPPPRTRRRPSRHRLPSRCCSLLPYFLFKSEEKGFERKGEWKKEEEKKTDFEKRKKEKRFRLCSLLTSCSSCCTPSRGRILPSSRCPTKGACARPCAGRSLLRERERERFFFGCERGPEKGREREKEACLPIVCICSKNLSPRNVAFPLSTSQKSNLERSLSDLSRQRGRRRGTRDAGARPAIGACC